MPRSSLQSIDLSFTNDRIIIIGNSGSGKTWLGERISQQRNISLVHMDDIRWKPGGLDIPRSAEEIDQGLAALKAKEKWILEGVFGKMAQECLPVATMLIWLDLPWEECYQNLCFRGPKFEEGLESQKAQKSFEELISWASQHESRTNAQSRTFFHALFESCRCKKIRLQNRTEVEMFEL